MRIRFGTTNPDSIVEDIIAKGDAEIHVRPMVTTLTLKQGVHMAIVTLTNEEIETLAHRAGVGYGRAIQQEGVRDRLAGN